MIAINPSTGPVPRAIEAVGKRSKVMRRGCIHH
jgi:hypothetical protein